MIAGLRWHLFNTSILARAIVPLATRSGRLPAWRIALTVLPGWKAGDARFDERLKALYEQAHKAGKWQGTAAVHNRAAYWAAGVPAYFDAAGQDSAPPDAAHRIQNREALRELDPDLFALVRATMTYGGKVDWLSSGMKLAAGIVTHSPAGD